VRTNIVELIINALVWWHVTRWKTIQDGSIQFIWRWIGSLMSWSLTLDVVF